jgi:hypothetical protein
MDRASWESTSNDMEVESAIEYQTLCLVKCPTPRAPDVWESARFMSIFLASGLYCPQSESTLRPHAGNANRWAFSSQKNKVT